MAYEIPGLILTAKSSGDMSGTNQYKLVTFSTTNAADGCIIATARGQAVHGVYLDNSTAAKFGSVQVSGVARVLAGDSSGMENAISRGTLVKASSVGQAVPSTATTDAVVGIALEALGTGSTGIIAVLLQLGASSTA